MALQEERVYTVDDIYALPDGVRAELMDGRIYDLAPPSRKHQRIVGELFAVIREWIKANGGTCEVNIAPFAVFLNGDGRNCGVREYWIVDDERSLVTVYDFEHGSAANYAFHDCVPSGIYPGFFIRLSELLPKKPGDI